MVITKLLFRPTRQASGQLSHPGQSLIEMQRSPFTTFNRSFGGVGGYHRRHQSQRNAKQFLTNYIPGPIESSFDLPPQLMAINIIQGHREWRHDRKWKVWGRVEIKWHIWKWRAKAIGMDGWRVDGGSLRGCCFRLGTIKRTAAGKVKIVKAISIKATGTLIDFRSEQYVRLMCHPRQQQVTSLFSL